DTGQRLAAKAEGGDALQVSQRVNLAGGVAGEGQRHIIRRDARAVVADADQVEAAARDLQPNRAGVGVQRVLDQLFDHRRGPLDHLSGGDLGGDIARQLADWHVNRLPAPSPLPIGRGGTSTQRERLRAALWLPSPRRGRAGGGGLPATSVPLYCTPP